MEDMIKKTDETYSKNIEDFQENLSGEKRFDAEELSEEQVKQLESLINSLPCPDHDFQIAGKLVSLETQDKEVFPVLLCSCRKCGSITLFSAQWLLSVLEST